MLQCTPKQYTYIHETYKLQYVLAEEVGLPVGTYGKIQINQPFLIILLICFIDVDIWNTYYIEWNS